MKLLGAAPVVALLLLAAIFTSTQATASGAPHAQDERPLPPGILVAEEFNPDSAPCKSETRTDRSEVFRCVDGELQMVRDAPAGTTMWEQLPGAHANASLSLNARLVGDTDNRFVTLRCRDQAGSSPAYYALLVMPSVGAFRLSKAEASRSITLVDWQTSPSIRQGEDSNLIELSCVGNRISARINQVDVAEATDDTYSSGSWRFGAGAFQERPRPVDARFDALILREEHVP